MALTSSDEYMFSDQSYVMLVVGIVLQYKKLITPASH